MNEYQRRITELNNHLAGLMNTARKVLEEAMKDSTSDRDFDNLLDSIDFATTELNAWV
jgi:hypothetical protein